MSDKDSLRQAILEEEARLVRIEKERAEALARLKELKNRLAAENSASNRHGRRPSGATYPTKDPFSSGWLTISDRIRAASEIPFEVELTDEEAIPIYMRISDKVLHLRRLGMTYTGIAERLGVNLWMVKKAARRGNI